MSKQLWKWFSMWWKSIVGENDYSSQLGVHGSFPTLVALAFQPRIINQQLKKVSQLKPMISWIEFDSLLLECNSRNCYTLWKSVLKCCNASCRDKVSYDTKWFFLGKLKILMYYEGKKRVWKRYFSSTTFDRKVFLQTKTSWRRIPTLLFTKDQKNSWIIYGSELPKFQLVGVCVETRTHSYTHVIKMSF